MGEGTKIEWTDHTFNPWWGCQRVSPGCEHCYAEAFAKRTGSAVWGPTAPRRFFGDKHWAEPLKWNAAAAKEGVRRRVFCASMADAFEDRPELVEPRSRLWALTTETSHLDWLPLTKRPENILDMVPERWRSGFPPNIWMGTTVEDVKRKERIDHLRRVPAAVRFLSIEPQIEDLGAIDLTGIHWVIVGGESGGGARPFDLAWARSLVEQCRAAGVAVFVKQFGDRPVDGEHVTGVYAPEDKRSIAAAASLGVPDAPPNLVMLRTRKGGDMAEWPEELRVRQWPASA
jgi:protein gp37